MGAVNDECLSKKEAQSQIAQKAGHKLTLHSPRHTYQLKSMLTLAAWLPVCKFHLESSLRLF